MPEERIYTEREISAILNRASEMQSDEGEEPEGGLTLAELQEIAAETGLDPRLVAAAAWEVDEGRGRPEQQPWFSAPSTIRSERVVSGEISEEDWADVSAEISRAFGVVGTAGRAGKTFEWTHAGERVQLQVRLTPVRGQTRIRFLGDFSRVVGARPFVRAIWVLQAVVLGFAWPLGAGASASVSAAVALAAAVLVYMLIHTGFTAYVRKRERAARRLLRDLERRLGEPGSESGMAEEDARSAGGRIELPDEEVADPAAMPTRRPGERTRA